MVHWLHSLPETPENSTHNVIEEADIQFDRDSKDPNKQALLNVAKFAIEKMLNAVPRDGSPFDPKKTYYSHINYEKCGVPSSGRRLYCARGWDPASIGMRIENETQQLFSAGAGTPAKKTTMLETFKIAAKANVSGAKQWLREYNEKRFTHQEGYANGFHGWFQTRDGRKFSWQGTTKYAGKLDANGDPLQWRPKRKDQDDLRDLSLDFLTDENYSGYKPKVKNPATALRIRDPSKKPGYRPVVMMPFFWVKMYETTIYIDATRVNTSGKVYKKWENQYVKDIPVNMEFIKRVSPEEGRVLMSFPGDWIFYCGDQCLQKEEINVRSQCRGACGV